MSGRSDFKVVMLGGFAAGKTSLLLRLTKSKFSENVENTIASMFMAKDVQSNGKSVKMGIWDTCGQERFRALVKMYNRDANAAIVCYDITDKNSWPALKRYVEDLREINPECKVYICGTKKDIVDLDPSQREVDLSVVSFYAKGTHTKWLETSSKTGENVEELFQVVADDISALLGSNQISKSTVDLTRPAPKKSGCRC